MLYESLYLEYPWGLQETTGTPASAEKTFGFEGADSSYGEVSGSFLQVSGKSVGEVEYQF